MAGKLQDQGRPHEGESYGQRLEGSVIKALLVTGTASAKALG